MRRRDDFGMFNELQGDGIFRWLLHEDVQSCSAAVTELQWVQESLFINDATTCDINDVYAFLAFRQACRVDQIYKGKRFY